MSVGFIFAVIVAIHVCLLTYSFTIKTIPRLRRIFLTFLLFGLLYDNTVLALGNILVDANFFKAVSLPRFYLHVIILPFLTLYCFSTLKAVNAPSARGAGMAICVYVITIGALAYGLYETTHALQLGPIDTYEHWRMTNLAGTPPYATIFTNIVAIILGALLWKSKGPPWLFLGAFVVFILNSIAAPYIWSFISSNITEIFFVFFLLKTEKALLQRQSSHQ